MIPSEVHKERDGTGTSSLFLTMALRTFLNVLWILSVTARSMVVHERRLAPPAGFAGQGTAPADEMLTLRVALTSNNVTSLEAKLLSLSSPESDELMIRGPTKYINPCQWH
ncbi:hypothetical protein B0H13DRAFT_2414192 [Mycena leptocephala]|nr:hypothetical protein B0H13DRAFT_2414192 [Mycena leptocephala]